ncbi:ferric reductase-like transmembrane domain-containing protein [Sphingobacterium sp. UBA5670]|uniref:ferric reductase-like transmembrane domain-containing protein n=1 Tax=Sphingobacterium sp. UBA5670 TaxID=1947502 RepID=UPI0025F3553A|nr:ferric reductase-like transmembrane domain-containing protein [Sphingobacterium sp. UBA5670]
MLGNTMKLPWWRGKYVLWLFLMLPGLLLSIGTLSSGKMNYKAMMHVTGELSGRFLLFSLIATPLIIIFPRYKFPKWLVRNKRYFGVAAFAYALYHTIIYLIEVPVNQVTKEFFDFSLITGWIAFIIWIPMVITSTDAWVKTLKRKAWKKIHNWGYLAALLAYLHWAFIHNHFIPALVHCVPVLLLQGYRWKKVFFGRKPQKVNNN